MHLGILQFELPFLDNLWILEILFKTKTFLLGLGLGVRLQYC